MKVIVTGGGTGGHLYPALSIARAMREREVRSSKCEIAAGQPAPGTRVRSGEEACPPERTSNFELRTSHSVEVVFVGSARGPEADAARREGFAFHALPSRPLSRKLSLQSAAALVVLGWGAVRAGLLLRQLRPDVVVGTGGYVSAGLVLAAALQRIPTVVHEQNVIAGRTNRLLGRFVTRVAVTFPESDRFFPAGKTVVTGLPIRPEIASADPEAARQQFGLDQAGPMLLVVGGSRGAFRLNQAVTEGRQRLLSRGVRIVHQLGRANIQSAEGGPADSYHPVAYIEDMGSALAAADLVLCRAGASTLAEVAAVGRPALLVPYPYAANDHQTENARVFVTRGAGRLVPDGELDGDRLVAEVEALLADPEALARMGAASRTLGRPDAAARVAELVWELTSGGRCRGKLLAPSS